MFDVHDIALVVAQVERHASRIDVFRGVLYLHAVFGRDQIGLSDVIMDGLDRVDGGTGDDEVR